MKQITVAITDDHQMVIKGLQTMLDECSHVTVDATYSNGNELLAGLKINVPDVLILDIHMPGMSGEQLTPLIANEYPELKILILTNQEQMDSIKQILNSGASGYLLKNTDYDTLITAIETINDGGQFIDRSLREPLFQSMLAAKQQLALPTLSAREQEILSLIAQNLTSHEIAERLFISKRTIDFHRTNLLVKLKAKNAAALVRAAIAMGFI